MPSPGSPIQAVPSAAQPWARGVEAELKAVKRQLGLTDIAVSSVPETDKTVFATYSLGQNVRLGVNGKVALNSPVEVRYVSSTGLFEVTVSMAGLVRDGAIFGGSFESEELPFDVKYDIPQNGVAATAPIGQTDWFPFAQSYSTIVSTRPGVQNLSMYLYAVCTVGEYSAAFLHRASLSVKAV